MDYLIDKYTALLTLLDKRYQLAAKYLELTEKQASSIASDNENMLLSLLDERASLAKDIDSVNAEVKPALLEYESFSGKGDATSKADDLIARTRELYIKCLTIDRKNMAAIKDQMNKATGDSKELQKRREGINKYAQADYIFSPSILDEHQ